MGKAKKKSKVGKVIKIIFLILLIALLIFVCWFGYRMSKNGGFTLKSFLATALGQDENTLKNLDRINILLLGESGVGDGYFLADSIMVCSYNPQNQQASIMSIPRDTYVGSKNKESASQNYLASYKMNAAYRNGTNIDETVHLVSNMLGIDIPYYAIVNTDVVIQIVDELGGITFNVPIDMKYDDPTQDLHIDLKAGEQLIDGEKAEQLLRFRHNNDGTSYPVEYGDNDIGRMRTQREFIQATMEQVLKFENIGKLTRIIDLCFDNLKTNMKIDDIKDYIPYAVEFNAEDLKTGTLPGVPEQVNGIWIYTYDETETNKLVQQLFKDEIDMTDEDIANIIENTTTGETINSNGKRIELLNGSGNTSKLKKAAELLQEAGFDVIKTGKTSTTSKTAIINRTGNPENLENEIKTILGVGNVSTGEDNANVDFTIIIGKNYETK